ncbi:hypothetical protein [Spirillospora sp. NPDC029432]|uniref:hypothetical protein n=1 Tax=Spirillospora sp. NPDC029432 TaxID=3154599 RepID=UPI003456C9E0
MSVKRWPKVVAATARGPVVTFADGAFAGVHPSGRITVTLIDTHARIQKNRLLNGLRRDQVFRRNT